MNIALTTDSKFIPHCITTICSICENNKDENIIFFIIHNGLDIATQNIFTNFINKYKNKKIEFYLFPEHLLKDFPVYQEGQPQHISLATYYRLFITKLLPENIDKLIYLDCDIIVRKSLKELWDIKIDNFSIAAAPDRDTYQISNFNRLKYDYRKGYFNAGVLLINLKKWRDENLYDKFLNFVEKHRDRILYHDQDVLNFVCQDSKLNLSLTYNLQPEFLRKEIPLFYTEWDKLFSFENDPVIVHYSESFKPWKKYTKHPYAFEYFKYRCLTPFPILKLENHKLTVKENLKMILSKFKICKPPIEEKEFRKITFKNSNT